MSTAAQGPFEAHSEQQLSMLLRKASNRLEMLQSPDVHHHEDDTERQRIQRLAAPERTELHREVLTTIMNVRAEFRRRAGD